jgi:hypothetical protein
MDSEKLALGIVLLLVGIGAGVWGLTSACSNSAFGQALLGVPSCSTTQTVAGIGGILFIIGIILAASGYEARPQVMYLPSAPPLYGPNYVVPPAGLPPPPPPPPDRPTTDSRTCPYCGTANQKDWSFCQKCSKRLPPPL